MKANKNSVIHDVHVNAVLNQIANRLFESKEWVDDEGNTLSENERREMIEAFKQSLGISPL